jgi:D-serine deaminase-like pyridoxal phosphate-dependent protein
LELSSPSEPIAVGDKVRLTIPHCDPTVNLYDHLHAARGEQVLEVWPIAGRGRSQ